MRKRYPVEKTELTIIVEGVHWNGTGEKKVLEINGVVEGTTNNFFCQFYQLEAEGWRLDTLKKGDRLQVQMAMVKTLTERPKVTRARIARQQGFAVA